MNFSETEPSCLNTFVEETVNDYRLGQCISRGRHSVIRSAIHNYTGVEVAVKEYRKGNDYFTTHKKVMRMCETLRQCASCDTLGQSCLLRYFEVFENERAYFIVMELAACELNQGLEKINERNLKSIVKDIISAILKIHKSGYYHGKLQLKSFIWDFNCNVKFKDVHRCRKFDYHRRTNFIGDREKETFIHNKLKSFDVWSIGKIIFELLDYKKNKEFNLSNQQLHSHLQNKIDFGKVEKSHHDLFARVTPQLCSDSNLLDLLARMLDSNTSKRIHLASILHHAWFYNEDEVHPDSRTLTFESVQRQTVLNINQNVMNLVAEIFGNSQQQVHEAIITNQLNKVCSYYWLSIWRSNSSRIMSEQIDVEIRRSENNDQGHAGEQLTFVTINKVEITPGCDSAKFNKSKVKIKSENYRSSLISLQQQRSSQNAAFTDTNKKFATKSFQQPSPLNATTLPMITMTSTQADSSNSRPSTHNQQSHIAIDLVGKSGVVAREEEKEEQYVEVKKPASRYLLIPKFESSLPKHLTLVRSSSTPLYPLECVTQRGSINRTTTSPLNFKVALARKDVCLRARWEYPVHFHMHDKPLPFFRQSSYDFFEEDGRKSDQDFYFQSQTSFLTF